jgi:hypothetical protein
MHRLRMSSGASCKTHVPFTGANPGMQALHVASNKRPHGLATTSGGLHAEQFAHVVALSHWYPVQFMRVQSPHSNTLFMQCTACPVSGEFNIHAPATRPRDEVSRCCA